MQYEVVTGFAVVVVVVVVNTVYFLLRNRESIVRNLDVHINR